MNTWQQQLDLMISQDVRYEDLPEEDAAKLHALPPQDRLNKYILITLSRLDK